MVEAARQAGVPVPLAAQMQSVYRRVMGFALAGEDFFGIVKIGV